MAHPVVTRQELDPNKGEGGAEEADGVENLPESCDLAPLPGSDHVKHLP